MNEYTKCKEDAFRAMRGACECALEAVKIASIYYGAKEAGQIDANGNWPLHNMLANAIKLADEVNGAEHRAF